MFDFHPSEGPTEHLLSLILNEVMNMDMSNSTIKELFYQQVKNLTLKSIEDSFDLQFSGTNPL